MGVLAVTFRQLLPTELRNRRTGEVLDVVVQAECPECGFPLDDANDLEGPLRPGSWWNSSTRTRCAMCGCVHGVRLDGIEHPRAGRASTDVSSGAGPGEVVIEDNHPAIVDAGTFNAGQQVITRQQPPAEPVA